jgi:hypothetical protein
VLRQLRATGVERVTIAKHLDLGRHDDYDRALEEFRRLAPWPNTPSPVT